jgi:deoxyribodipyrimidine photo-lyase
MVIVAMSVDKRRTRTLKDYPLKNTGPVIYWMGREQRASDNWALLYAQELALNLKRPLVVIFTLAPGFLDATLRQYSFMLDGLKETSISLEKKNISFSLLVGDPPAKAALFINKTNACSVVTDFEPLKIKEAWKKKVAKNISVAMFEVDARNIVPCFFVSPKQEFGAYTLRPKINRILLEFATPYPPLKKHPYKYSGAKKGDPFAKAAASLKIDESVKPVNWVEAGESAAKRTMKYFIKEKLARYPDEKNDASKNALSYLSPYLHFGQISSLTVFNEVKKSYTPQYAKDAFLEELVVRRELADNFCLYNKNYDSFDGLPDWAKKTLVKHKADKREYLYSLKELEYAKTHDALWNAAQLEMVNKGKMHGYLRMYWGKKILEWSKSPEDAIKIAIYLNDRYELDGRDTNGYAGIMWAIGGLHDRAWGERDIFGKVRFMSYNSQIKKFNFKEYIKNVPIS